MTRQENKKITFAILKKVMEHVEKDYLKCHKCGSSRQELFSLRYGISCKCPFNEEMKTKNVKTGTTKKD
jgi:hypothetical protein